MRRAAGRLGASSWHPEDLGVRARAWTPTVGIMLLLLLAWWLAVQAGGSRTVLPHLFYVPIIVAALRFGGAGAALVALVAGVLAGPLLPADTATGQAQETWGWVLRGTMFVGIGQLTAWLPRHTPQSARAALYDAQLASRLRQAMRHGDVELHYQPIVDLRRGTVAGVEALARWTHPVLGPVSPGRFVPAAERVGMIADFDRYVLRRATEQARAWVELGTPVMVSVNVSAIRFGQPGLLDDVDDALLRTGLDPRLLQLEITETAVMHDLEASSVQIAALRGRGVRIAVDDFGAGQTSLGHFHRFTADTVKLDRTFVVAAAKDPRTARLLRGLMDLFASLGADVVGEGISDENEYLSMLALGCPRGQGFFLGRPAPVAEVDRLLLDRSRIAGVDS